MTLFSLGIYPLIDKPSQITDSSATLIVTIFTNELNSNITSGLLINDISDHLLYFVYAVIQTWISIEFLIKNIDSSEN